MLVHVLYGAGKVKCVNANVPNVILLDHLRRVLAEEDAAEAAASAAAAARAAEANGEDGGDDVVVDSGRSEAKRVDLVDLGEVDKETPVELFRAPTTYANTILADRGCYVLLRGVRDGESGETAFSSAFARPDGFELPGAGAAAAKKGGKKAQGKPSPRGTAGKKGKK